MLADGSIRKVPSTPLDPSAAVAGGLDGVAVSVLAHGTTVATNALLEGNLAPVALVTNEGLEDVIEIARQNRPSLYDQFADRPPPLVPRDQRFGVAGRLAADGSELTALGDVPELDGGRAVAICLLHADLDPSHERAVAAALRAQRMRRHRESRDLARDPRVRAHRHDRGQRRACVRSVATTSPGWQGWRRRCS